MTTKTARGRMNAKEILYSVYNEGTADTWPPGPLIDQAIKALVSLVREDKKHLDLDMGNCDIFSNGWDKCIDHICKKLEGGK